MRRRFRVSECRACRVLKQHRSTHRYFPKSQDEEGRLVQDVIERARQYGRYGYRRVAAMLRDAGWQLNDKRIERLWRREGLKAPMKQPMRSRLWLNDGSCIRLKPQHVDHVWSYAFVHHRRVQPRMSGDQSKEKAQFDRCDRRPYGLIPRSRCSSLNPLRQWAGVYR